MYVHELLFRSHSAIVEFTSEAVYKQKLFASGRQLAHPQWHPLTFFASRGRDVQEVNTTGYHNDAEVGFCLLGSLSQLITPRMFALGNRSSRPRVRAVLELAA